MTHAPHMTNTTLSRGRRHLRTHHYARIQLPTRQKLMTPTKYCAKCANADKPNPELGPMGPAHRVYQTGSKAIRPPKSP